ncbi:hypothetical protein AM593_02596, partial [Mytilus galloprovincialis]
MLKSIEDPKFQKVVPHTAKTPVKKDSTITLECMHIDKPQFYYRRSDLQDKYYFSLASTRFCR